MISIEIRGLEKFMLERNKMEARKIKLMTGVDREVSNFAHSVVRTAKLNYLSGPRPERLGVVTGRLRASVGFKIEKEIKERGDASLSIVFGTDVEYGRYHEQGTSRLKARPFLRPAVEDNMERFNERLDGLLQIVSS